MDAIPSATFDTTSTISRKVHWPEAPAITQAFSLPSSIMYYMAKNPSTSKFYLKMAMSCKYFFEKIPILVVRNLHGEEESDGFNTRICSNDENECIQNNGRCCVTTDLSRISSQLWLTNRFNIVTTTIPNYGSLLCQKLYRSECLFVTLRPETLMFNDFKLLASAAEVAYLPQTLVKYDDGKPVMLEAIIEAMPKIEYFRYTFGDDTSMVTATTMKKIMKLQNNLKGFQLSNTSEIFPVEDFSAFIKKVRGCGLFFGDNLSEEYKAQLDVLVDEIIDLEIGTHVIQYGGQDFEKFKIMVSHILIKEEDNHDGSYGEESDEEDDD